jgi:hypothetical protein
MHITDWLRRSASPEEKYAVEGRAQSRAPRFTDIEHAIDTSRALVNLPEDWDDEGAKPILVATWEMAADMLRETARTAYRRFAYLLPAPNIGPCADGSIDLYWSTPDFTLLINVRPDGGGSSDFWGERSGMKVEGPIDLANPNLDFLTVLVKSR